MIPVLPIIAQAGRFALGAVRSAILGSSRMHQMGHMLDRLESNSSPSVPRITVKVTGLKEAEAWLGGVQRQLPYAISKAINEVAKEVVKAEQQHIRSVFTVRNQWPERGPLAVKRTYASKAKLMAMIYSNASFLPIHMTGGTKRPRGSNIAVPTSAVRRTKRDIIAKNQRPRNLKGAFVIQTRKGPVIAQRKGQSLSVMYGLEKAAHIKPVFKWEETALKTIERTWEREFNKALDHAIKTAR